MQVHEIKLTHFRGLFNTEIKFQPGFNLIVGANGSGKTSVLNALRILLSQALPLFAKAPRYNQSFDVDDIMVDRASTQTEITFSCHESDPYTYRVHKNRELALPKDDGGLRDQVTETPDKSELTSSVAPGKILKGGPTEYRSRPTQPLVLYFSVRRAHVTDDKSKVGSSTNPAYFGAFSENRGLRIQDLVDWWKVKEEISKEAPSGASARQLQAVREALARLMPNFINWRIFGGELWVTKKVTFEIPDPESNIGSIQQRREERSLQVWQLSDGERSTIALVFDLARRLAQLNDNESNPNEIGEGIVLIDELDLHLHPKWQRRIIEDLRRTFPKIQFICTTHSPFLIQSQRLGNLIQLDKDGDEEAAAEEFHQQSIEDIAENVMGIPTPQKSQRYRDMIEAAENYFRLLKEGELVNGEQLTALKIRLDELSEPFSDDPAFQALLRLERTAALGGEH